MMISDIVPRDLSHSTETPSDLELEAFASELDALRNHVMRDLGERDVQHIRRVIRLQRIAEVTGRGALFASVFPPMWFAGTAMLALSKVLENMEIGHNVLHGQYNFTRDPALNGSRYEWDWSCSAEQWRHSHNYIHHTFTNVVGKDRDVGYGLLRMADEQAWLPLTILQPIYALGLMLAFEAGVAVHDLELNLMLTGRKPLNEFLALAKPLLKKTSKQVAKDYVLFPLLAGPAAPLVFAGNLSANVARNVWAFSVIFCGHFPDGTHTYDESALENESRGAWYLRQVRGSANIEGPAWMHVLTGHLSHQIEHHLFPDMPASRYPEIADEVRAICQRYGIAYNTGSMPHQLAGAWRRILRLTLPSKTPVTATVEKPAATTSRTTKVATVAKLTRQVWRRLAA